PLSCFFTAPPSTQLYTLSLHDALPIFLTARERDGVTWIEGAVRDGLSPLLYGFNQISRALTGLWTTATTVRDALEENERLRAERSEEHTSELQSRENLVCRLLLEKKKK